MKLSTAYVCTPNSKKQRKGGLGCMTVVQRWHGPALLQRDPPGGNKKLLGPFMLNHKLYFCRPDRPVAPNTTFRSLARNITFKSQITTLKFSVHCPLDTKTV